MKKLLSILLALCLCFSMVTVAAVSVGAAEINDDNAQVSAGTKTITVGVISHVMSQVSSTDWAVHYWGGADGAKDASLTATGKTEQKAVGSAYWNNQPQTFTMFTADVPSDFTGYKVHNGNRWFGDDGPADKCTAYVFNYSGDKALYEKSAEPEPETTVPVTTEAPTTKSMYLNAVAVFNEIEATHAFAWTWQEGVTGKWVPIEKFGYVSTYDNVTFAFFNTDTPSWDTKVAQTIDFTVQDGKRLTLNTEKDENGNFKGTWEEDPTEEPETTTEPEPETTTEPEPETTTEPEPETTTEPEPETTTEPEPETTTEPEPETTTEPAEVDYYLFGWINGANYACEGDAANMGDYKFVDGTLKATFESDSYVAVKADKNAAWYMTDGYPGDEATSAKLFDTSITGENSNKLRVPGGVEVTFTLTKNEDGSFTLSYVTAEEPTTEPEPETTTEPEPETTTEPEPETTTEPEEVDYYLFGWINGANYACEGDAANMGDYKFVDGTLKATFESDSYVAVKADKNAAWYMTDGYPGDEATSAKLFDTSITGENSNKLRVPGGVEVTFTLTKNEDGSFTLSYVAVEEPTTEPEPETTTEPEPETTTEPAEVDYYLFGWINGANYACEGDAANMGDYKFVDGTLKATFESDSYVAVKADKNAAWYMTDGYPGDEATSAKLFDTSITGENSNKLRVPGGVEVTFTLTKNEDGSFTLSYVAAEEPTTEPEPETTTEPEPETTTEPAEVDYYLFGWINGANYACEGDAANMGDYKFVDGTLKATFESDSYVAVKADKNAAWYMTDGYPGDEATSAKLFDTSITGENSNKLRVPGGVEVTFTLTKNEDGSFTLSYTTEEPEEILGDVNGDGKVTIDDATLIQRYLAEMTVLTDKQLRLADVNKDGKVNIRDVSQIQRFVAEYISEF